MRLSGGVLLWAMLIMHAPAFVLAQDAPSNADRERAATEIALGRSLFAARRFARAAATFQRAATLDPSDPTPWAGLGGANIGMRNWASALRAYERALELRPEHPELHVGRGRALVGLGARPQAIASFMRALEFDPSHRSARAQLLALGVQPQRATSPPAPNVEATPGGEGAEPAGGAVESENTRPACMDGTDNDGDGAADCLDTECAELVVCAAAEPENTSAACRDGADNDADGHADCADQDCWDFVFCAGAARASASVPAAAAVAPRPTTTQTWARPTPPPDPQEESSSSHPLGAVGGGLFGVGVLGLLVGGALYGSGTEDLDAGRIVAGFWMLVINGVIGSVGLLLWIIGSALPGPRSRRAPGTATLRVGPGTLGLEVLF